MMNVLILVSALRIKKPAIMLVLFFDLQCKYYTFSS